jgi:bifunctional enzyme CysN/CysC
MSVHALHKIEPDKKAAPRLEVVPNLVRELGGITHLLTCGSVDDGKSTLIGRLLYDTKQILVDQLEHIEDASRRRGHDYVDLALLTDGLRAEREQGITIDVAYRSFVTPRRRFQLADAPGHVQYTRNMVTGASTADVAVILVDARKGVIEQTRRHSYIIGMLALPHVVYAVNKMDLVEFSEERFDEIARELAELGSQLEVRDATVIPLSALKGDNVVDRTESMPWYAGPTLLEHLETIELDGDRNVEDRRFPVQWVIRPMADEHHDYRGYAGRVAGGVWRAGDEVVVLPSGLRSRVAAIDSAEGRLDQAVPRESVTLLLEDDVDVSRGDLLADPERPPVVARELTARVSWMAERPVEDGARLLIKHTTRTVPARVDEIVSVVDIHTLQDLPSPGRMELNDLGVVRFRLAEPLVVDEYVRNRGTGAFILIDESTNETVGAGMVVSAKP